MLNLTTLTSEGSLLVMHLIALVMILMLILMSLRIVWRVEKQLDTFFKLLTLAFFLLFIIQLMRVLVAAEIIEDSLAIDLFRLAPFIVFISALLKMNALIRKLDKEK
ncbi:MAG: hypothetical protein A3B31_03670 [Candidatus Komeilibacteria bacterium RIFCSPLOWO2_01_FULL_53_11]|uniref:Uncharacterized protein n=1 Tax=Candidatus Komeilibacteria bacterium RIFCSPLOWO2_01_FULL_53_11 TaxID=1798552 RepID=A0A1G2BNN8_9BACT|nr:MAG: hypothetical protein A3B31_03670 [Candidatus Komeilibacteria bacterium RIFCSPLOWO2_01_FULL_53_11]